MGLIGLIIPMEGGGGSEDSHWPPGVHSFDPKPLFPDAGMDWLNTYLLQAVVGAIIVIVVWLWLAKDQKVVQMCIRDRVAGAHGRSVGAHSHLQLR